jgi:UDP-N-acetylglucosamine--dolichyl-phosphate N-acetylglucosaminephosphotransferase
MELTLLPTIITFAVGFFITLIFTPFIAKTMEKKGFVGVDVHKKNKPVIPTMCGISILVGLSASIIISCIFFPRYLITFVVFLSVVLSVGLIGVIDDYKKLDPKTKPVLLALASLPILISGTYSSYPILPIVGGVRLTIVYPFLVPFAITVPANAVNMMDVLNGVMSGTSGIIVLTLGVASIIFNNWDIVIMCSALLGCLIAFYYHNRFPAKVFGGDTGSLAVGAALGALAVIGSLEVVAIIAMMPHIMNAFYGLSSIGRLYERREIAERPTFLLGNGQLAASSNPKAPLTLTRTILASGPMKEEKIVKVFFLLTAFSGLLAIFTVLLTV